jgi:hypothetical protein
VLFVLLSGDDLPGEQKFYFRIESNGPARPRATIIMNEDALSGWECAWNVGAEATGSSNP